MNPVYILAAVFAFDGFLLAGLALPMMLRQIGPNGYYGFRTAKTMSDEKIWYDVNAYAGCWLFAAGVVTLLAAVGLVLVPEIGIAEYGLGVGTLSAGTIVVGVLMSFRKLRNA